MDYPMVQGNGRYMHLYCPGLKHDFHMNELHMEKLSRFCRWELPNGSVYFLLSKNAVTSFESFSMWKTHTQSPDFTNPNSTKSVLFTRLPTTGFQCIYTSFQELFSDNLRCSYIDWVFVDVHSFSSIIRVMLRY